MLSHVKSMMAVGLALAASLASGLWFFDRAARAEEFEAMQAQLESRLVATRDYSRLLSDLDVRRQTIRQESQELVGCLAKKDMEEAQLVEGLARTASAAGVGLVGVARADGAAGAMPLGGSPPHLARVTYRVVLKGDYASTVKFFQGMTGWRPAGRLESLEIVRGQEDRAKEQTTLVISVFSPTD